MSNSYKFLYKDHDALLDDMVIADRPVQALIDEIMGLYLEDTKPWIIGFSGGKDSTAVLSLIYCALIQLKPEQRHKHIYVLSSDTLVETPVVVNMINKVLDIINTKSKDANLPISAHPVYPKMDQTFWVNLLGRGYPAPQQTFRWCTDRMKIEPVSNFILSKVAEFGEVIVVLGSRSEESASRAQVIDSHAIAGSLLSRHASLPNAFHYMPIKNWTADDVWMYLMGAPCPWGGDNQELFGLYKGSNQGECPLVIDKSTPSCGNSRFGCWTCTVVTKDRALHGLIESGEDWMRPLLDFRNKIYVSTAPDKKSEFRNYKRRSGMVTYNNRARKDDEDITEHKIVQGPYWMSIRQAWLKELLQIEKQLSDSGHDFPLIRKEELQAIRQEWLRDPNEPDWADSLPRIYAEVYSDEIDWIENDAGAFTEPDRILLDQLGQKHNVPSVLIMKLIEAEISVSGLGNRKGIMNKLERIIKRDWEDLEEVHARNEATQQHHSWKDKLEELKALYDEAPEL